MKKEFSSFRDCSGFIFYSEGKVFRAVHKSYFSIYKLAQEQGLYNTLFDKGLFIRHKESDNSFADLSLEDYPVVLEADKVPFVSYPYEWTFSQLKDAALLTLKIQNFLLEQKFTLKDASAYNVQFINDKPVFIDTLSLEEYEEGKPWKAYKQFCEHFLVPLLLMKHSDIRLQSLLKGFINGIPLEMAVNILPSRMRFSPSTYTHIYLQQNFFSKYSTSDQKVKVSKVSIQSQKKILANLFDLINSLRLNRIKTQWADYYAETNYQDESFSHKKEIINEAAANLQPQSVWDIGANTGVFSRIFSERKILTISFDIDPLAAEQNYLEVKQKGETDILPLLLDITNPSPGIGWANKERTDISERGSPDMIMALALIHHLFITYNCSFGMISRYFASLSGHLVIEFVPAADSQVQKLIRNREDNYDQYTLEEFEKFFLNDWDIISKNAVRGSVRIIYTLKRKQQSG
jgi:ribosomal protein L11 methylase PrmA